MSKRKLLALGLMSTLLLIVGWSACGNSTSLEKKYRESFRPFQLKTSLGDKVVTISLTSDRFELIAVAPNNPEGLEMEALALRIIRKTEEPSFGFGVASTLDERVEYTSLYPNASQDIIRWTGDLIEHGLLAPGDNVVRMTYRGHLEGAKYENVKFATYAIFSPQEELKFEFWLESFKQAQKPPPL